MYHYNQPFRGANPPRQPTVVFNHNNINSLSQPAFYRPTPYTQPSTHQNTTLQTFQHSNNLSQQRNQQYRLNQRRESAKLNYQQIAQKPSKTFYLGNQINNIQTKRPAVNSTRNYSEKKQTLQSSNYFSANQSSLNREQFKAEQKQKKLLTYQELLQENRGLKQIVDHEYLPMKHDVKRLIKQKQERDYLISELQWKLKQLDRSLGNSVSPL